MSIARQFELGEPQRLTPRYLVRAPAGIISREEFNIFRMPTPSRLIWDIGLIWAQAILAIAVFAIVPDWRVLTICLVVIGGAQQGLSLVAHEAGHRLIVPSNPRLNDAIGRWLFAGPIMLPYSLYRQRHFVHHREVGTTEDTKFLYRCQIKRFGILYELFLSLSGLDYVQQVISVVARFFRSSGRTEQIGGSEVSITYDLISIATTQLMIAAVLTSMNVWYYPLLWILPNITWNVFFAKIVQW